MNFVEVTWSYILVPNMCHFQRLIEQIFNFKVWRRTRFQMEDGVDTSWKQILFTPPLHTLFLSFIPSFNLPPLITAPFLCVFFVVLFSAPFLLLPFFFFGEYLISLLVNWPQMDSAKLETFSPRQLIGLTPFQLPSKLTKPRLPSPPSPRMSRVIYVACYGVWVIGLIVYSDWLTDLCNDAPGFLRRSTGGESKPSDGFGIFEHHSNKDFSFVCLTFSS